MPSSDTIQGPYTAMGLLSDVNAITSISSMIMPLFSCFSGSSDYHAIEVTSVLMMLLYYAIMVRCI